MAHVSVHLSEIEFPAYNMSPLMQLLTFCGKVLTRCKSYVISYSSQYVVDNGAQSPGISMEYKLFAMVVVMFLC